jgi:hypothetical protein
MRRNNITARLQSSVNKEEEEEHGDYVHNNYNDKKKLNNNLYISFLPFFPGARCTLQNTQRIILVTPLHTRN